MLHNNNNAVRGNKNKNKIQRKVTIVNANAEKRR
jgi:hypothetical protein